MPTVAMVRGDASSVMTQVVMQTLGLMARVMSTVMGMAVTTLTLMMMKLMRGRVKEKMKVRTREIQQ